MDNKIKFYKARYIVAWQNGEHRQLENGFMGIRDGKVEGFCRQLPDDVPYENLGDAAITPGFINLHCHPTENYGSKSFREDNGNPFFYDSTMYDCVGAVSMGEESIEIQAKLAMVELLTSGCTTLLIFGGPNSAYEAKQAGELGVRAYIGAGIRAGDAKEEKNIWDSPDGHSLVFQFNEAEGLKRIEEAERFVKEYDGGYGGRIRALLAPTQTMTCTPDMLKTTRRLADRLGVGITIHGAEDYLEFEQCVRYHGMTPVQYMNDNGMLGSDVIIAHCLAISGCTDIRLAGNGNDLGLLGKNRATVAHCPWALSREGQTLQSFRRYTEEGVNMGIGTDSFPSDIIQEMRQAAVMGKLVDRSAFSVTAKDVFNAATINGAKAFGRTDIGRLEPGAKADFVVFRLDNIEMSPVRDVVKNIVYSATRHSVEKVFIEGECIVSNGKIKGIDERLLSRDLQAIGEKAWANTSAHDRLGRSADELSPLICPKFEGRIIAE